MFTLEINGLYKQATGCRITMYCTDEVLYGRLERKVYKIVDVIDDHPRHMLRIVEILTLE